MGKADIASKVYGLYENNIQKVLAKIKKPILIDIGAADGFLQLVAYIQEFQNIVMLLNKVI